MMQPLSVANRPKAASFYSVAGRPVRYSALMAEVLMLCSRKMKACAPIGGAGNRDATPILSPMRQRIWAFSISSSARYAVAMLSPESFLLHDSEDVLPDLRTRQ